MSEPVPPPSTPPRSAGLPQPLRLVLALALLGLGYRGVLPLEGAVAAFLVFAVLQPPDVALRPLRAAAVLAVYLPFVVLWFGFVIGYVRAAAAFGWRIEPQPMLEQVARDGVGAATLPILFGGVLLAPLVEEILFRGYLLGTLRLALPSWPAQLLTAALFGLVHGWNYALPIAVLGLLFGWLRQRHDALAPAILAHAVHNALTFAVTILWPRSLDLIYPQ